MVKEADSEVGLCSWITYWPAGNENPICDGRWSTNFPWQEVVVQLLKCTSSGLGWETGRG